VQIAAEVSTFEGKVCGDKHFAASRRAQDGAIIADAEGNGSTSRGAEVAANLLDQG